MNFDKLIAEGKEKLKNKNVSLILLGASGSGKSRACGTFGVKTLYLHTSGESHGPASASVGGADVLPICLDRDGDTVLTADETYARLLEILNSTAALKKLGIGAIAIDGASELETIITNTTAWKTKLTVEYKGVKSYAGELTLSMFRPVLVALQKLQQELNVHTVITCILHVKELGENGEILEASPSLYGYGVATGLIQQFADILIIGQLSDGEKTRPGIQLGSHVSKVTKDQVTKEVRKLANFHNRITGADLSNAPAIIKPSLKLIAEIKKLGHYPEV